MKNPDKKIFYWFIPLPLAAILALVWINNLKNYNLDNKLKKEKTIAEQSRSLSSQNKTEEIEEIKTAKKVLAVDPERCRGCGKCARLDPEHFKLTGRIVSVISQENLDSKALENAIFSCPVGAISLK